MLPSHVNTQTVLRVEGIQANITLIAAGVVLIFNVLFQTLFYVGLVLTEATHKFLG